MPFAETQEFAGIGVVLIAPKLGYFGFKLADGKFPRVTNFFEEADSKLFKKSRDRYEQELHRVQLLLNDTYGKTQVDYFKEITRPRESVIHFGEINTVVSNDVNKTLDELYRMYVGRDFVNKTYREANMAKALKEELTHTLGIEYRARTLRGKVIDIRLPLTHESEYGLRAIKPMAFQHPTPIALIDHGVQWVDRIDRFIKEELLLPNNILFALESPTGNSFKLKNAYIDIRNKLEDTGARVTEYSNTKKIVEFAKIGLHG